MRISVLQQRPRYSYELGESPELSFLRQMKDKTMDDCFEMLEEAARRQSDLAVTIETVNNDLQFFDTRYRYSDIHEGLDGPTVERFSKFARKSGMHIVTSLYLAIDGKSYNCGLLFNDSGELAGLYKKVHLPAGEEIQNSPGDEFKVFKTKLGEIGILICYDLHFPESARELALMGAELIAYPTWGWEGIWGPARAYDNGVCIATAQALHYNCDLPEINSPSCIVDNTGRIVCSAGRNDPEVVTGDVDIHVDPPAQYRSERFSGSMSMKKTRFLTRRPDTYKHITLPADQQPLYKKYFPDGSGESK